ncbi:hypothetical protein MYP_3140 [Sporocytophaga myxococcoides]|uniref:Uncharacterized protein n=1 Tax=Sporocytophaga myxococcoides TaxID=153721 RepID=A0A098LG13_9BACT|nr:hypothetical protein MYP_3140 [Sporocytophaga myxococcoides]
MPECLPNFNTEYTIHKIRKGDIEKSESMISNSTSILDKAVKTKRKSVTKMTDSL